MLRKLLSPSWGSQFWLRPTCGSTQTSRFFGDGHNPRSSPYQRRLLDEPIVGPQISTIISPFRKMRMLMAYYKVRQYDKEFNPSEFESAVPKAAVAVAQLIKSRDFEALQDLLPKTLVAKVEQACNYLNDTVLECLLGFKEDQIGITMIQDIKVHEEGANIMLHVFSVLVVNQSWEKTQKPEYWFEVVPTEMLTVNLQLSKRLSPAPPENDFVITALNFFHPFEHFMSFKDKFIK